MKHSKSMSLLVVTIFIALLFSALLPVTAFAAGGDYSLDFSAARPGTYDRLYPTQIAPPGGRASNPLDNAQFFDNVESLAPDDLALFQIIPFEILITVGDGAPENDCITFVAGWESKTTSNAAFGYHTTYGVYAAFVDPADGSASGGDTDAYVNSSSWIVAGTEIQGTIEVCGLDPGEHVVVEVWLVLQDTIPVGATGNVQSGLISAVTSGTVESGQTINTGIETVPLQKVQAFFQASTDVSVTKSDSPDPVDPLGVLTYTIDVYNDINDNTVANNVILTDYLDPYTSYSSYTVTDTEGYVTTCSHDGSSSDGKVTCDMGFLNPGELVFIDILVNVLGNAPTSGTKSIEPCDGSEDLCNIVDVTAITDDPDTTNNVNDEPTDVEVNYPPDIQITKSASPGSVPETGGDVTFTFTVDNIGQEDVTLTSLTDSVFGDLNGQGDCVTGGSIPIGGSYSCSLTVNLSADDLADHYDVSTAVGTDDDGTTDTDTDDETVTFEDVLPDITITKTANPTFVPEPGGDVEFTIVVTNNSLEDATIDSLVDSDFDLAVHCSDAAGTVLAYNASYTCVFTETITGNVGDDHYNTATVVASDNDGNSDTESDSADVTITNVDPVITVTKDVYPATIVDQDGGDVTYTVVVNNGSVSTDPVTIDSLVDDVWYDINGNGLVDSGEVTTIVITDPTDPGLVSTTCDDLVGTQLKPEPGPGNSATCTYTVYIDGDGVHKTWEDPLNTVTVTGHDDEGTQTSASDTAQVDITSNMQSSIMINSLSAALDDPRLTISGEFNITDESEGLNKPDGWLILLTDYEVDWEYKFGRKDKYEWADPINNILNVNEEPYSYNCTYWLVEIEGDPVDPPLPLGDDPSGVTPVVFDESITIEYTCTIYDNNSIPKKGYLCGTSTAEIFDRDNVFKFSNDWKLDPRKGL